MPGEYTIGEIMEKGALVGSGRTADVYAWGEDRILKLYQDWMPAVAVEREFTITRLARAAGLPVPATEELVQLDGRLGIIFERIRGTSLLKILETRPGEFISIARLLAELHARMHACILPPETPSQREQIEQGIAWAKDLAEAEKQSLLGILARLPDGNAVCHGDFHPDNILMSDHGPVIIDWMTGRRGHPLADVARTVLLIQTGGLPPRVSSATRLVDQCFTHVIGFDLFEPLSASPSSFPERDRRMAIAIAGGASVRSRELPGGKAAYLDAHPHHSGKNGAMKEPFFPSGKRMAFKQYYQNI